MRGWEQLCGLTYIEYKACVAYFLNCCCTEEIKWWRKKRMFCVLLQFLQSMLLVPLKWLSVLVTYLQSVFEKLNVGCGIFVICKIFSCLNCSEVTEWVSLHPTAYSHYLHLSSICIHPTTLRDKTRHSANTFILPAKSVKSLQNVCNLFYTCHVKHSIFFKLTVSCVVLPF